MIFFITSETSYEVGAINTIDLENKLQTYFESKYYGEILGKISTIVICVSEKFNALHPIRLPKISKNKLSFEFKLDFETYKSMADSERTKYIAVEYFNNLTKVLIAKKIKGFDSNSFLQDLEIFLKNEGLLKV